jgi:hypothetical protein
VSSHPLSSLSPPLPPLPSPRVLPSSPLRARAPSGAAPWHLPGAAPGPPARLPWPPGAAPWRPRRGSLAPPPPGAAVLAPAARLPGPLRAAVPAPVRGPCLRQRGPPARSLRASRRGHGAASRPPFTQRVPACAAPCAL